MLPLKDEKGAVNGVVAVNYPSVSEKERLYHLQKQFSFVLNSMSSGLLIFNQDQVVTGYNKQAEDIFGLPPDKVLGASVYDLYNKYIDGTTKQIAKLISTMEKGIPISDLERTINMEGRNLTIRLFGNPIKNALNDPVGYILIVDDLTELLAMREAMFRNEKFALIGQFAAGIAHEIRNPLTTVFGFLQLYAKESIEHENFRDLTSKLLIPELDRANTILSDFLMVSRPQAPQRAMVDTKTFLVDVVRLIESEAHLRGVMLNVQTPDEPLPSLNLDVQQMKQVFLNLYKNGLDVTPPGGSMTLTVRVDDKMVWFDVVDQGPGISTQDLTHIFEPFYTTKDNGTGLGLPLSHRIIEGHGGSLKVSSIEGVGTTFTISIPTTPYP
jgi:PAS domain S-box-containing protein